MSSRAICLCLALFLLLAVGMIGGQDTPAAKAPVVVVQRPLVKEVSDYEDFTGRVEAIATVDVRPRVSGMLEKIDFKPGATVKRGDVLFEINPRIYQAEAKRAEGEVDRAESRVRRISRTLTRARRLQGARAISQEEFEQIQEDQAEAAALLRIAEAVRIIARFRLAATKVTAPIAGRIVKPLHAPGALVTADSTHLATIDSVDPIHVAFDVDERTAVRLLRMKKSGKAGEGKDSLSVRMGLAGEEGYPHQGKIDSLGVRVNPGTGTLPVTAAFANPEGTFLPGMFARIRLTLGEAPRKALLIEDAATATDGGRRYVLVVNDKNVVERRDVTTGGLVDGLRVVKDGLDVRDRVIVKDLAGLRPAMAVQPKTAPPRKPAAPSRP
jgi:multidrug efflux system membrane fusion protein